MTVPMVVITSLASPLLRCLFGNIRMNFDMAGFIDIIHVELDGDTFFKSRLENWNSNGREEDTVFSTVSQQLCDLHVPNTSLYIIDGTRRKKPVDPGPVSMDIKKNI